MTEDLDAKLKRALDSQTIEQYVARGRSHAETPTDKLRQMWPDAFRLWVDDRTDQNSIVEEDIRAELLMRGIELNAKELAPEAHEIIISEIHSRPNWKQNAINDPNLEKLIEKMAEKPN